MISYFFQLPTYFPVAISLTKKDEDKLIKYNQNNTIKVVKMKLFQYLGKKKLLHIISSGLLLYFVLLYIIAHTTQKNANI